MTQPLAQPFLSTSRLKRPRLRFDAEGEGVNHASWLELFFDLVFVVVIAELSHTLEQHLSWHGFLQFAALFVPCWWAVNPFVGLGHVLRRSLRNRRPTSSTFGAVWNAGSNFLSRDGSQCI